MMVKILFIFLAAFAVTSNFVIWAEESEPSLTPEMPAAIERDPMMPANQHLFTQQATRQTSRKINPFKISGIGKSIRGAYVVLDGEVYSEGETKGEITVVKIEDTKVDILINGIPESLRVE